jgi:hypothetical protein
LINIQLFGLLEEKKINNLINLLIYLITVAIMIQIQEEMETQEMEVMGWIVKMLDIS